MKRLSALLALLCSQLVFGAAVTPFQGGTGVANNNAATLTRSGNHALTITTTGTTGVTLPTTGTLATLAGTEALTNKTINGNTWTAGTGTLTIGAGKTATLSNTLTFTGTDGSTVTLGSGGTVLYSGGALGTPSSGNGSNITNVNAATLGGATFASPGPIGSGTPGTIQGTTVAVQTATITDSLGINFTPATGTNQSYVRFNQDAGRVLYFGVDNSTGTFFGTAGNYGAVLYRTAGSGFAVSRAGTVDLAISGTGAVTIPGNLVVGSSDMFAKFKAALTGASTASISTVSDFGESGVLSLGSVGDNSQGVYLGTADARTGTLGGIAAGIGFLREASDWNSALAFYTNGTTDGVTTNRITEAMRINSSQVLLIGTASEIGGGYRAQIYDASGSSLISITGSSSSSPFDAWNKSTSGDGIFARFITENSATTRGSITYNRGGGLVAYNTTSDRRAKDVFGLYKDSGTLIDQIVIHDARMKGAQLNRPMFIADELQSVLAWAVTGKKDAVDDKGTPIYQQVDHASLVPLLTAEIKALRARVTRLEAANDGRFKAASNQ